MDLKKTLKNQFGFSDFRPGQEEIVRLILNKKHLLAVLPTGAGKSLCYQLPAVLFSGRTLVISPLIALMNDQTDYLQSLNIPSGQIHSHRKYRDNQSTWRSFICGDIKILYISPERLMTEKILKELKALPIEMFVIDEAHCISKWGAGFRPEYEQLSQLQAHFPKAVLSAFTATADTETRLDIVQRLTKSKAEIIVKGFDRPNLFLSVLIKENWKKKLLDFLNERRGLSGIIYTLSRRDTEEISDFLNQNGFHSMAYHAGQTAKQRQKAQDVFMTENGMIMTATIAFGMGIDKPDIRFVIHTHLPSGMEAFYQEIGRAGRDGQPADTLLFYGLKDLVLRRKMIENGEEKPEYKLKENKRLDALVAYCFAPSCRRKAMLAYFGEACGSCHNCDNCLDPPKLIEGSRMAQIFLSAVVRTKQIFGIAYIIDIVRGIETDKVKSKRHNQLPTFGRGADQPKMYWRQFALQLVSSGALAIDIQKYGALTLTQAGWDVLYSRKKFFYKKIKKEASVKDSIKRESVRVQRPSLVLKENQDIFVQLKKLRLKIAREKDIPAFVVFSDRTLIEMANLKPKTKEEMLRVNGVGPYKIELYGKAFLKIIQEYEVAF